jgi:hypothetical protein
MHVGVVNATAQMDSYVGLSLYQRRCYASDEDPPLRPATALVVR